MPIDKNSNEFKKVSDALLKVVEKGIKYMPHQCSNTVPINGVDRLINELIDFKHDSYKRDYYPRVEKIIESNLQDIKLARDSVGDIKISDVHGGDYMFCAKEKVKDLIKTLVSMI